jgi:hypothetical protein
MKKQKRLLSPEYQDHVRMFGKREAKRREKQKGSTFPGIEHCLEMMRSKNAMIQEEGFYFLAPQASKYLDALIAAFQAEEDNHLRAWLLELIAEAKSPQALPILIEYANSSNHALRGWAKSGLKALNRASENSLSMQINLQEGEDRP